MSWPSHRLDMRCPNSHHQIFVFLHFPRLSRAHISLTFANQRQKQMAVHPNKKTRYTITVMTKKIWSIHRKPSPTIPYGKMLGKLRRQREQEMILRASSSPQPGLRFSTLAPSQKMVSRLILQSPNDQRRIVLNFRRRTASSPGSSP